jgi:hypothetical protein
MRHGLFTFIEKNEKERRKYDIEASKQAGGTRDRIAGKQETNEKVRRSAFLEAPEGTRPEHECK